VAVSTAPQAARRETAAADPVEGAVVLIDDEAGCMILERGAVVTIRRALMDGRSLEESRRAFEIVHAAHPGGVAMLSVFRLDRRFPIDRAPDYNLSDIVATLRAVERVLGVTAVVLEFGGLRAAAMRAVSRTAWTLARLPSKLAFFDCLTDAAAWLELEGRAIGVQVDTAGYVTSYREASRTLAAHDPV
jgi:hypothetical protein